MGEIGNIKGSPCVDAQTCPFFSDRCARLAYPSNPSIHFCRRRELMAQTMIGLATRLRSENGVIH